MDYELQLKIKNAPLLNLMRSRGYDTAAALSRAAGISQQTLGTMLSLKVTAYSSYGEKDVPRTYVKKLADFFGVSVEDLYPRSHLRDPLRQSTFEAQVSEQQLAALSHSGTQDPMELLEIFETENRDSFQDIIDSASLTTREKKVLNLRYRDNKTLDECGKIFGVTRERIRMIESKSLRKMRKPGRSSKIKDASGIYAEKVGISE